MRMGSKNDFFRVLERDHCTNAVFEQFLVVLQADVDVAGHVHVLRIKDSSRHTNLMSAFVENVVRPLSATVRAADVKSIVLIWHKVSLG